MVLSTLGYTPVLGYPAILWGGLFTFLLVIIQVSIAFLNLRMGIDRIPMGVHRALGYVIVLLALFHAALGLAAYI